MDAAGEGAVCMTQWPRLLDSQMRETARLHPLTLSLNLRLSPLSTARMTLTCDDAPVNVGAWVELFTPQESAGIFRVTSVTEAPGTGIKTVTLEHGFGTLADRVIYGRRTVIDAGEDSVSGMLRELMAGQSLWVLDRCDCRENASFCFANANVLSEICGIVNALGEYVWQFDQSSLPWRASLIRVEEDAGPECELRLSRNIVGMEVNMDRTDMFTRIYPLGSGDVGIESVNQGVPYLEKNTDVWGVVEVIDRESGVTNPAQLMQLAQAKLDRRCEPIVSVNVDGLTLCEAAGEPMDVLRIGRMCRIPLPEHGMTITERIVELNWRDVLGQPQRVTVSLANRRQTVSALTGAGIGRFQEQTGMELGNLHEQTAELTTQMDGQKKRQEAQAQKLNGIESRVSDAEGNVSLLQQTALAITGRVESAEGDVAQLKLTAEGLRTDVNKKVDDNTYQSYIQQTATEISAKVSSGDIASSFTMTDGNITLFSKTINLDGYVTAKAVSALEGSFDSLMGGDVSYGTLSGGALYPTIVSADGDVFGETLTTSGLLTCSSASVGGTDCAAHTLTIGGKTATFFAPADATFELSDLPGYDAAMQAAMTSGAASVELEEPTASFTWSQTYHDYSVALNCKADNGHSKGKTTRLAPTEAIEYGKTLVTLTKGTATHTYAPDTKIYAVKIPYTLSNGTEGFLDDAFVATEAYDAGYESGKANVTISSHRVSQVGPDRVITIRLSNGDVYSYEV